MSFFGTTQKKKGKKKLKALLEARYISPLEIREALFQIG